MYIESKHLYGVEYYVTHGDPNCITIAFECPVEDDSGKYHLLEHLMACGNNDKFGPNTFHIFRNSPLIKYINAFTKSNYIGLMCIANDGYFDQVLEILFELIFNAAFNQKDIDREKARIYLEALAGSKTLTNKHWTSIKRQVFMGSRYQFNSGGVPNYVFDQTRSVKDIYANKIQLGKATIITTNSPINFQSLFKRYSSKNVMSSLSYLNSSPVNLENELKEPIHYKTENIYIYSLVFNELSSLKEKVLSILIGKALQMIVLTNSLSIPNIHLSGKDFMGVEDTYSIPSFHFSFRVVSDTSLIKHIIDEKLVNFEIPYVVLSQLLDKIEESFKIGRYDGIPSQLQLHQEILALKYQGIEATEYNEIDEVFDELKDSLKSSSLSALINNKVLSTKVTEFIDNLVNDDKSSQSYIDTASLCTSFEGYSIQTLKYLNQLVWGKASLSSNLPPRQPKYFSIVSKINPDISELLLIIAIEEYLSSRDSDGNKQLLNIGLTSFSVRVHVERVSFTDYHYKLIALFETLSIEKNIKDVEKSLTEMIHNLKPDYLLYLIESNLGRRKYNFRFDLVDKPVIYANRYKQSLALLFGCHIKINRQEVIKRYEHLDFYLDDRFPLGCERTKPSRLSKITDQNDTTFIVRYKVAINSYHDELKTQIIANLLRLLLIKSLTNTALSYATSVDFDRNNNELVIKAYSFQSRDKIDITIYNSIVDISLGNYDSVEFDYAKIAANSVIKSTHKADYDRNEPSLSHNTILAVNQNDLSQLLLKNILFEEKIVETQT